MSRLTALLAFTVAAFLALAIGAVRTVRSEVRWRTQGPRAEGGILERLRGGGGL